MTPREAILAANDLDRKAVPLPEWGGQTVYVQLITGHGRAAIEKAYAKHKGDPVRAMADIVIAGVVDADGKPTFQAEDADALMGKRYDVLERLYTLVLKHNDADAASMESAAGKSDATPSASSS